MPQYTQEQFSSELQKMLSEAKTTGQTECIVVARELHARVVGGWQPNRMPMACGAMWNLWTRQGSHDDRIIYCPPKRKGARLEIKFDTDVD